MNRKEYELVYDALKNYHVYMDRDQRIMAEQILDDLYYPREVKDRLDTDKTGQEFREELDEINTDWQPDDVFDGLKLADENTARLTILNAPYLFHIT